MLWKHEMPSSRFISAGDESGQFFSDFMSTDFGLYNIYILWEISFLSQYMFLYDVTLVADADYTLKKIISIQTGMSVKMCRIWQLVY